MGIKVKHFFDPRTSALTYVVHDVAAKTAVVIDPVAAHCPRPRTTALRT